MRASHRRRVAVRTARFESIESRLLLSISPVLDPAPASLVAESSVPVVMAAGVDVNAVTGLTNVRTSYGFDGTGQTVVVIDTGIAYQHTALGGGFGAGYQVVGGYDFAERDGNPYDDGPAGSHGTHVAGIIGSQDASRPGVAPGVDLVSLRVFDDSGAGSYLWVEEALQWVHANRNSFANPITTVNLSLGSDWNAESQPAWSTIEDELAMLEADGIFIAVAAGNSFSTYQTPGLSYPASSSHVVPVMSVDSDGSLSYYSQRHSRAIAAPGRSVLSTVPDYVGNRNGVDDDYARFSGTSMAAPYVAAASVLLRQAYQFVGINNVTQATLYELMRNTADVIYDAATNQDYLRLNIQRALDTIMPADDFGSSAAAAYQLGAISGARSVSGTVAQLGDHDFFTFTAGQSGRVTFSVNATGNMQTHWDVATGGTIRESQGNTVSLDVIAGQTYTVGLGTANGLGHYTINIQLEASSPVPDGSGARQEHRLDHQVGADGQWFVFTAGQQGLVTFEAFFANWRGDVDLELFDANQQFLVGSYSTNDYERIDVVATAGQTFYLRAYVSGWEVNDDVDLRITNLVSQVGDRVTVFGTQGDDQFTFNAGATHTLSINGVGYSFSGTSVRHVDFQGLAGSDTATLTGTMADETAYVRVGSAEMTGPGYDARLTGVENVTVVGGGGGDSVYLYDSAGNDTFTARPFEGTLSGAGFSHRAVGARLIAGIARGGGADTALFYDSAGDDTLTGSQEYTRLRGEGFTLYAKYFEVVVAAATAGGTDTAILRDSRGDDVFAGKPAESLLWGSGYQIRAQSFDTVCAIATAGGKDRAYLYDSAGDDVFVRRDEYSVLRGNGFCNRVKFFEDVEALSENGGQDLAYFFDSALSDTFKAFGSTATIANARSAVWAYGFDRLNVSGGRGLDRREVAATDYVLESRGLWQ